jgi:intracellular sulfur oxidation DsrE/DsrF family protein
MTGRRDFIARMGVAAATLAIDPAELRAASEASASAPWDTSWIDRLATARHRAVFNGTVIDDGAVMSYAEAFLDHFREVHNTTDADTRPVIVFRRLGTPMALNDRLWERYPIGADTKINDAGAPARRNRFAPTIEAMHKRGMISLVCNVSVSNIARQFARAENKNVEEVQEEFRANLVSGVILVPSGIYALIRAQNAGCAFMLGT